MYEKRKEALLAHLRESNLLHDDRLERAFHLVPLEEFIPPELFVDEMLYMDRPLPFYFKSQVNRRTISAPHMICIMLEYLNIKESDEILMLGSKSGYIAALVSLLCSEGHVFVVDSSQEVLEMTRANLESTGFTNITLLHGNPLTMAGTEQFGTWDKILVPYQVEEGEIKPALETLDKDGGVLFAPIGDDNLQFFTQIIRDGDKYYGNRISTVIFSPLEKNVTFFSQQVELLQFMKSIEQDVIDPASLESEIQLAINQLEARKKDLGAVQRDYKEINIIYDSPVGERLHEHYRRKANIPEGEESGLDFKIIEDMAVSMAMEKGGKIKLHTITNKTNVPMEVLKLYLKKSKKGHLEGDASDIKNVRFALDDPGEASSPEAKSILLELQNDLPLLKKHLKDKDHDSFKDLIDFFYEKLAYLDENAPAPFSVKPIFVVVNKINSLSSFLREIDSGGGQHPPALKKKVDRDMKEAMDALERFVTQDW